MGNWRVVSRAAPAIVTMPERRRFKVIACPDGDTLLLLGGPHRRPREWVRMLCMDTPEKTQKGFRESRAALRDLVLNKWITLEPERKWKYCSDKYGRTLGYVLLENLLVNAEIVRLGWSDYVTKFGRGRYSHVFQRCVTDACDSRRGIWSKYKQGDSWAWGRGRKRPHFRTSDEMTATTAGENTGRIGTDGKVFTNFGSLARINS